jgi:hypothetical protein
VSGKSWSPAEREQCRALIAEGKGSGEIGDIMGRTAKSVLRVSYKHGLGPWLTKPGGHKADDADTPPADFADRWQTASQLQLAAHYQKSTFAIGRWCKVLGLERPPARNFRKAEPVAVKAVVKVVRTHRGPVDRPHREATRAGEAAEYLRRFGPVFRCDAGGRFDSKGDHWARGRSVLTDAELIERAQRQGWNPDAWRMVA